MNRKELIEKLMNVAENYKNGYLYGTGALTDIGVLVDEYTEKVVKNMSIPEDGKKVSSKLSYCRKFVNENGVCKRCRLDKNTHDKMVMDCEEYNSR